MTITASNTTISDVDYEKFRDYFYHKTGIFFNDSKRYFVDKRIIERMEISGYESFQSYFSFVHFQESEHEFQELVNVMTVNETYFFREDYQLECMCKSVLDEVVRHQSKKNTIKIWSVPCSTGEEPYSIALYLLEYWPWINEIDVEIYASDIDTRVIQKCREGIFNQRSIQYIPENILRKHFNRKNNDEYQISQELIESVNFSHINLCNVASTRSYRNFDLIFCRNLLIYFDDLSRRKAIDALYDALNIGGFIFLGHSESMSRSSSLFKVRKFPECIIYQK